MIKELEGYLAGFIPELSFSILHLTIIFTMRWFLLKSITESDKQSIEMKQRWKSKIKTIAILLAAAGLMTIWMKEVYSIVLSLAAVAVAIIVATKELMMCFTGTFYRVSAHPYSIGERIEFDGMRGDVVEIGLLSTRVLEIGPGYNTHQYSGRMFTIPHNLLFNHKVINESFFGDFVLHLIEVNLPYGANWHKAEDAFLKAMNEICGEYVDMARQHMEEIRLKKNLEPPRIEPRVHVRIKDDGTIKLVGRITVPNRLRGRLEQSVIRRYLEMVDA